MYPIPAARLSSYVRAILVIENEQLQSPFVLPLFANGTPTLLFTTAAGRMGGNEHYLTLFGQTVLPQQLLIADNFKLIAYFLQPYALSTLFNISALELTDKPIALNMLTGRSELQEQLLNAAATNQLLQLIDDYLYSKITAIRREDKRLIYASERISSTSDKHILTTVQHELHMTERTFQRLFEQHIGVSPNQFRRIWQFNQAFGQINNGNFRDLSAVAYHHGYADQSHFIRTFKKFTQLTPSAYLRSRPDL
ncbi:helix-turn-helix domain-containing protein [Mucilaginibacter sp. AW1-3]